MLRNLVVMAAFLSAGGMILLASLSPQGAPGSLDKLFHFAAYAVWACAAAQLSSRRAVIMALCGLVFAVGLLIEIVQPAFGRSGSLLDALANGAGTLVGAYAGSWLHDRFWSPARIRRWIPAALAVGCGVVAYTGLPVFQDPDLSSWDCDASFLAGDEVGGGRAWSGEVLCARLSAGGADLHGAGEMFACDPLAPENETSLIFGTRTPFGVPTANAPWRDARTRAFCETARGASTLVLDALIRADAVAQTGPARIVTFSRSPYERNLTLAQEGSAFDLRVRNRTTGLNGELILVRTQDGAVTGDVQRISAEYRHGIARIATDAGVDTGPVDLSTHPRIFLDRFVKAGGLMAGLIVLLLAAARGVLALRVS